MSLTVPAPVIGRTTQDEVLSAPARPALRKKSGPWFLPRTMVGLVAICMVLAIAPILASAIVLGLNLDRVLTQSEKLVSNGQQVEALGAQMRDQLSDLQRVGRQYLALEDPALLPLFDQRLRMVRNTAKLFGNDELPPELESPAAALARELRVLGSQWRKNDDNEALRAELVDQIGELSSKAARVVVEGRLSIHRQVQNLHHQAQLSRKLLITAAIFVVPLTVLLAFALSIIITRPMKQLRAGIAALGTSNYGNPIQITYPRELARLGDRLEWLRHRLRSLEADKDRFLRDISHELKTPLASLREGTDLLSERALGPLNSRQAEVSQILAESAQDLDAQIANLLAYAEWRSGQQILAMNWFDARKLMEEIIASQRLPLAKRGINARLDIQTVNLYGQRSSLRVAISNLLSNAIKHSPQGAIIDISLSRHNGRCAVSVRDRGRGVPDEDRDRIFLPFVRGPAPNEGGNHGTGIGLSIVSETIRAHGGALDVQNAKPGAKFLMDWPCPNTGSG